MHKGLVLLAAAAVTGGSYYLVSQAKSPSGTLAPAGSGDVEELSAQEAAAAEAEKNYSSSGYGTSYDGSEASDAATAAAIKEVDEIAHRQPGSVESAEDIAAEEIQAMDALTRDAPTGSGLPGTADKHGVEETTESVDVANATADVEAIDDADDAGEMVHSQSRNQSTEAPLTKM